MQPANRRILTINGGSSSIKFALYEVGDALTRLLEGAIGYCQVNGADPRTMRGL